MTNPTDKLIWRISLGVLVTHLLIVFCSLIPGIRGMSLADSLWASDQSTYITNARLMIAHGAFTRSQVEPFLWEPYRTPGLPLIIYLSLSLFDSLIPVLFVNVLLAGAAAYFGCRLLLLYTSSRNILIYFGILLALLPNVLGTDCYVLTDSIYAYLNLIWIYFFLRAALYYKITDLIFSSLALAYAQLTKPTLSVAIVLIAGMLVLLNWNKWKQVNYSYTVILLLLSLAAPLFLSWKIYASHGVFTPTLLGEETKREYLTANYLADKTGKDYYQVQQEIRNADWAYTDSLPPNGQSYYGRLYLHKKHLNDSLTKADPGGLAKVFLVESIKQLIAPQEAIFGVFYPSIPKGLRVFGGILNISLLVLVILGCWVLFRKKLFAPILIIGKFYGFYIAAGSMSSRQGGRFKLPADVLALPVAAIGLHFITRKKEEAV